MEKTGCTYLKKSLNEFILSSCIHILLSFTHFISHTYIGASIRLGKLSVVRLDQVCKVDKRHYCPIPVAFLDFFLIGDDKLLWTDLYILLESLADVILSIEYVCSQLS